MWMIAAVIAAAALVYLLMQNSQRAADVEAQKKTAENLALEKKQSQDALAREVEARKRAEESARQAEDAARMAREKAGKEDADRQKRLDELNARLLAEAKLRAEAEKASTQLNQRMQDLAKSLEEARALAAKAEEAKSPTAPAADSELAKALAQIEKDKATLAALQAEKARLESERAAATQRQVALEEQIMKSGGAFPNGYRPLKFRPLPSQI